MGISKNVVIAHNLQWAYLNSKGNAYLGDEKAKALKERLKSWLGDLDIEDTLVYLTKDIRSVEDEFYSSQNSRCLVGSDDLRLVEYFQKYTNTIIQTTRPSALYKTPLLGMLSKYKIHKVFLVGVETHMSVLFTAYDLKCRGFDVSVIEPLVGSKDDYMHSSAIALMANDLGIDVLEG